MPYSLCGSWSVLANEVDVDWKGISQQHVDYLLGKGVNALGLNSSQKSTNIIIKMLYNLLQQKFLIALKSNSVYQFIPTNKNEETYIVFNTSFQSKPNFKDIYGILHFECFIFSLNIFSKYLLIFIVNKKWKIISFETDEILKSTSKIKKRFQNMNIEPMINPPKRVAIPPLPEVYFSPNAPISFLPLSRELLHSHISFLPVLFIFFTPINIIINLLFIISI
jgi:hypothetical protein